MTEQFTVKVEHGPEDLVELVMLPIEYKELSPNLLESLLRYRHWGDKRFGNFIRACLENNLQNAFASHDGDMTNLKLIVKFIYNRMPALCWGSKEKVEAWEGINNLKTTKGPLLYTNVTSSKKTCKKELDE